MYVFNSLLIPESSSFRRFSVWPFCHCYLHNGITFVEYESQLRIETNYKPKCRNIWLLISVIQKRCNDSSIRRLSNTPHTWKINCRINNEEDAKIFVLLLQNGANPNKRLNDNECIREEYRGGSALSIIASNAYTEDHYSVIKNRRKPI